MYRTPLILLDHIRFPLKLLGEETYDDLRRGLERKKSFDQERRGLERTRRVDPDDPHAANRLRQMRVRAGEKPDEDHHWRWNGKGWYTRPDWNDGRCPPNSEPTDHNSCLPQKGHNEYNPVDHAQYHPKATISELPDGKYRHRIEPYTDNQRGIFDMRLNHNSPYHVKSASDVDLDHKDGPQIGINNEIPVGIKTGDNFRDVRDRSTQTIMRSPSPLPSDPTHLPIMFARWKRNIGVRGDYDHAALANTRAKLRGYYVKQGYDGDYVDRSMVAERPSEPPPV